MADATAILNQISGGLDALATNIQNLYPSQISMLETWGWNQPAMSITEVADFIRSPKSLIIRLDANNIDDVDIQKLHQIPSRILYLQANTIAQLPGGNGPAAFASLASLVQHINSILDKYINQPIDLKELEDKNLLPAAQLKKLKQIEGGIRHLDTEVVSFEEKIREINDAHNAALSFPSDIQMLEDTREKYHDATLKLSQTYSEANDTKSKIDELLLNLSHADKEAASVLANLGRAYSAATTQGLGAAFSERARALTISTWILGIALAVTLSIGAAITYYRVEWSHKLMLTPNISYGILFINLTYTALSVSAPIWLAWLLTRQIGQRFRIAEDYGYKSSIAKAYEGYRKEAVRLDPALEQELFSIALDKLEEHPLRLVEHNSPGSPAHDAQSGLSALLQKSKTKSTPAKAPSAPPAPEAPKVT